MPQFDFTTIFSVTFSAAIGWAIYYSFFSIKLLSEVTILSKFRTKLSEVGTESLKNLELPVIFIYKKLIKISKK